MTKEEVIRELDKSFNHRGSVCPVMHKPVANEVIGEVIKHLQASAPLPRWTPKMGTPPDGLYIADDFGIYEGYLVEVKDGQRLHCTDNLPNGVMPRPVMRTKCLYGPIPAPEGGEAE